MKPFMYGAKVVTFELDYVYTEPDWIGFFSHGTVLEPVRNRSGTDPNGSKIGPVKKAGPVLDLFGSVPDWFQDCYV